MSDISSGEKKRLPKKLIRAGSDKAKGSDTVNKTVAQAVKRFARKDRPFTPDEYGDVVSSAMLSKIVLVNSTFSVSPEVVAGGLDIDECRLSMDRKCLDAAYIEDASLGVGMFEFSAIAFRDEDGVDDSPEKLEIRNTYMVVYDGLSNMKPEAVKEFVRRVGEMAAYPYFRNMAAQYSWASSVNIPVMPVLK